MASQKIASDFWIYEISTPDPTSRYNWRSLENSAAADITSPANTEGESHRISNRRRTGQEMYGRELSTKSIENGGIYALGRPPDRGNNIKQKLAAEVEPPSVMHGQDAFFRFVLTPR